MELSGITVKYKKGDKVWNACVHQVTKKLPCPDCKGERKWKAISPAGQEYEFQCPRCSASFQASRALSLSYQTYEGSSQPLTIGSVRLDTNADHPVSYMCEETGVGSGTVYYQENLFESKEEAEQVARLKAANAFSENDHYVGLYNERLDLSDYKLDSALIQNARLIEAEASLALRDADEKIHSILDEIALIATSDQVLSFVDDERAKLIKDD